MSKKSANVMKAMGATFAVCSAVAMMTAAKTNNANQAKKTIKKTADKVIGFMDTMTSMM
ncbi:MAG: hypothetical protein LIO62_05740 [Clostridiales bacterium]|nr:hypothetical protein [Clostridiales bacterium]